MLIKCVAEIGTDQNYLVTLMISVVETEMLELPRNSKSDTHSHQLGNK